MLRNKSFSCHIGFEIHPAPPVSGGGGRGDDGYLDVSDEMSQIFSVLSPLPLTPPPLVAAPLAPCGPTLRLRSPDLTPPPATLLDGTAEHTKAKVAESEPRNVPDAVRRTAAPGVAIPAAAPEHPVRA